MRSRKFWRYVPKVMTNCKTARKHRLMPLATTITMVNKSTLTFAPLRDHYLCNSDS